MNSATLGSRGIYTVRQAAKLVRVSDQRLRGWVFGYSRTKGGPVIQNEIQDINNHKALSFGSLLEARVLREFTQIGLHLNTLRAIAREAREFIDHPHPFTSVQFKSDGRRIFAKVKEQEGSDPKLYDLAKKNWAMYGILEQFLLNEGLEYGPEDIRVWKPDHRLEVVLRPNVAFGQPALRHKQIPTNAIKAVFDAEDSSIEETALQFRISKEEVEQALAFELRYAA